MTQSEEGDLTVNMANADSLQMPAVARGIISHHPVAERRTIKIYKNSIDLNIKTDSSLHSRFPVNMMRTLEASNEGRILYVGSEHLQSADHLHGSHLRFYVKNDRIMPEHVKMHIFRSSFSTKTKDCGPGTHSMKITGNGNRAGAWDLKARRKRELCFILTFHKVNNK